MLSRPVQIAYSICIAFAATSAAWSEDKTPENKVSQATDVTRTASTATLKPSAASTHVAQQPAGTLNVLPESIAQPTFPPMDPQTAVATAQPNSDSRGDITDSGVTDPQWMEELQHGKTPPRPGSANVSVRERNTLPEQDPPLSKAASEVAQDMNIIELLRRLHHLKHSLLILPGAPSNLELLSVRMELLETIFSACLETQDVIASLDTEISKYEAIAEFLEAGRDKAIRNNNIVNFTASGALQSLGSIFQIGTGAPYQNVGNEIGTVQGGLQGLISSYALKQSQGARKSARRNPNMLAPILERAPVDYSKYPPGVWAYLSRKPMGSSLSRRETLLRHWIEVRRIPPLNSPGAATQLDALAGTVELQKQVTIDLLRNRIPMLGDVRAVVSTVNQSLHEIMSYVRRP